MGENMHCRCGRNGRVQRREGTIEGGGGGYRLGRAGLWEAEGARETENEDGLRGLKRGCENVSI